MLKEIRDRIVAGLCSVLDHVIEDDPTFAGDHLRLAKIKYRTGDFRGAIADLEMTLKHEPRNADALYWKSRARYEVGDTVPALHDAMKARDLRPDDAQFSYMLGNVHMKLANYDAAEEAYSVAIQLDAADGSAFAGRGYSRYAKEQFKESLSDLLAAQNLGFDGADITEYIRDIESKGHTAG